METLPRVTRSGARLPLSQVIAEVFNHSAAIMRHQNAVVGCGTVDKLKIANAVQSRLLS